MNQTSSELALTDHLLKLEHEALAQWCCGNPSGFLELSDQDVVYFDPFLERRLDGLDALTEYYEALRGKLHAERFELLNPKIQAVAEMAVLTYNFTSYGENGCIQRWNCTEIYRKSIEDWRIIQTHWSLSAQGIA